jgi:hypothetical protein
MVDHEVSVITFLHGSALDEWDDFDHPLSRRIANLGTAEGRDRSGCPPVLEHGCQLYSLMNPAIP